MKSKCVWVAIAGAVVSGLSGAPVLAQTAAPPPAPPSAVAKPDVATLLFAIPEWSRAPAGSVITYDYAKKTSDASFGPSFDDHIVVTLSPGDGPASRTAAIRMFTGANAKPAGPFRSDQQNPVLLLVLEENVQELSKSFKANPRYLKSAIRKAWRDSAKIEPAEVNVGGKLMPGTRISVQPFLDDPEADKMKGLDKLVYTVDIADSVPGYIAAVDIRTPAGGTAAAFSETLRYGSAKTP